MSQQQYQMPSLEWLYYIFQKVDRDNSGQISAMELQSALSNGTWKPFNYDTVLLMIRIFDKNRSGSINFQEFQQLWKYVNDWIKCFALLDLDKSGSIDKKELQQALYGFGYILSDNFYNFVLKKYDRDNTGSLNFDSFIHLCVTLQILTASFQKKDTDMKGVIRISFEDFLILVLDACH